MTVRVGVDVGGTFTKAVAFDLDAGAVCAEAMVATTHQHADGVAAGVVEVVARIADQVGADRVQLVTHSSTQAVNALLEGDVATVGMVGMGRSPDLRKARKRTVDARIDLGDGRLLPMPGEFLDVTEGLDDTVARDAVERLRAAGATSIAVAEAFAPDDLANEAIVADAARAGGLPVTTSAELTGLYGLELRAVTAAMNASILPIAIRTAEVVERGVAAAGIAGQVMVMRGDAGATDLDGFRSAPARTLYSGPAASVVGALRFGKITDGIIVEVGGTSTNVAPIRRGRPALSYVRVASHSTAIRALDVRVLGVAGGSMLRSRRNRVYGVGPRSAHIAGLRYACYLSAGELSGATTELIAPRSGDPADYVVVTLPSGERVALTLTCAANALGLVEYADYARGDTDAALAAFEVAGRTLRLPAPEVARRMLTAATQAVGDLIASVVKEHKLTQPSLVAVGGGAGGLGRAIAAAMRLPLVIPEHAEVISAIGDALSHVRAEREAAMIAPSAAELDALIGEVEADAVAAGAAQSSLEARVEHLADRSAVRVTVTGTIGLSSGAMPGRAALSRSRADELVAAAGFPTPARAAGQFWLGVDPGRRRVTLLDRYGDRVVEVSGTALPADARTEIVAAALERATARMRPAEAWLVAGSRVVQIPEPDVVAVTQAAAAHVGTDAVLIVGQE